MRAKSTPGIKNTKGRANMSPPGGQLEMASRMRPPAKTRRIHPNTMARRRTIASPKPGFLHLLKFNQFSRSDPARPP